MNELQNMPSWRLRKYSLQELNSRTGDLDSLWPDEARIRLIRDKLTAVISGAVGCPDGRFIPTDSFLAIFNNFRSWRGYDSLDDAEMLMEIENVFGIELPGDSSFISEWSIWIWSGISLRTPPKGWSNPFRMFPPVAFCLARPRYQHGKPTGY